MLAAGLDMNETTRILRISQITVTRGARSKTKLDCKFVYKELKKKSLEPASYTTTPSKESWE